MFARQIAQRWIIPFVDPRRILSLARIPSFLLDLRAYRRQAPGETVRLADSFPCLLDRTATTPFDPHYFYQGAWLARKLAADRPRHHVDVGSSVLTMSVLSAFVPTTFVDYRPLSTNLGGLSLLAANATQLPFADRSLASVSSLHVVEHVGLGRYGDPIDPGGTRKALAELARVVAAGGRLFVTTPVGRERVCFNAHRVSAPKSIVDAVAGLRLVSFAFVDDAGNFVETASRGWRQTSTTAAECSSSSGSISGNGLRAMTLGWLNRSDLLAFNLLNRDRWVAAQAASLPAGARVLDAGAGSSPYRALFKHCRYETQDFAQLHGEQLRHGGYGTIDYVCDIIAIPVADATFDAVLCTEVLEHHPEPIKVVNELARVLKPGGVLLLTAPLGSGIHQEPYHFYGGYTPYWYARFLEAAGFEKPDVSANGGTLRHFSQEAIRFAQMTRPFGRMLPFGVSLLWAPLWILLLPILVLGIPLAAKWLDKFDREQRFTVGYHVRAQRVRREDTA